MKFEYNSKLYPKEVLIKAAYSFIDKAYIHLDFVEEKYVVEITPKEKEEEVKKEQFDNEMLVQSARYIIAKKTLGIREIILGRALASTLIDAGDTQCEEVEASIEENTILKDWFEKDEIAFK